MQSLHNMNFDNYGYTMGSPFQDLMNAQRNVPNVNNIGDQGLSPPYSNQSPPYSVQSNVALSPQGYIGKYENYFSTLYGAEFILIGIRFIFPILRFSITSKKSTMSTNISNTYTSHETCNTTKTWSTITCVK